MKVIFNLTLFLLLFSCKTANNLETGSISIPSEFDSNSTLQSIDSLKKNITDSSLSYQVFFKDSILLALIDEALAQNLDLKMMHKQMSFLQRESDYLNSGLPSQMASGNLEIILSMVSGITTLNSLPTSPPPNKFQILFQIIFQVYTRVGN